MRQHGRHVLNRYEDGMEKCIGCELCAGVCPAKCIYVRGADNPPDAPVSPGERYGFVYEINYLRCIHCDLCVEACPTEAITETKLFEFSFTNRNDAIYTKAELVVGDDGRARRQPWELWLGGEDDDTSAWMRATAPAGNALYEGRVGWSGELGFGVRPPRRASRPSSPSATSRHPPKNRWVPATKTRRTKAGTTDGCVHLFVFAALALASALGVVLARNPVHAALLLVVTLVSVAVFFLQNDAPLLAAVQIIVYAGAIVVLFLFVIMLLGVDRDDSLHDPVRFQRPAALALGAILLAELLFLGGHTWATGKAPSLAVPDSRHHPQRRGDLGNNIERVASVLFTDFLWPFEITAALLVLAVVGSVVLARRSGERFEVTPEPELASPVGEELMP